MKPKQVIVGEIKLALNESRNYESSHDGDIPHRSDRYLEGTIVLNGKQLPLEVHLIIGGQFDLKRWDISAQINGPLEFDENLRLKSEHCPECSGNWGVSDPETKGDTAIAVNAKLRPFVEAMGYKLAKEVLHKKWGMHVEVNATIVGPKKDCKAPRFYCRDSTPIECPVHGKINKVVTEFNA